MAIQHWYLPFEMDRQHPFVTDLMFLVYAADRQELERLNAPRRAILP
jgi:hypothetical protein